MSASKASKACWKTLALAKSIGLGEDTGLHLRQQEIGECRGRVCISRYDEGRRLSRRFILLLFFLFVIFVTLRLFLVILFSVLVLLLAILLFLLDISVLFIFDFLFTLALSASSCLLGHPLTDTSTWRWRRLLRTQLDTLQGVNKPKTLCTFNPILL